MPAEDTSSQTEFLSRLAQLGGFRQPADLLAFALHTVAEALRLPCAAAFLGSGLELVARIGTVPEGERPGSQLRALAEQACSGASPVQEGACTALPLRAGPHGEVAGVLVLCAAEKGQRSGAAPQPLHLSRELQTFLELAALALDRLTQQEVAAQAQRQAERAQHLLQASPVAIAAGSLSGALTQVNDAYLKLLGYTRAEFEAGRVDWASLTPPEYLDADADAFARAFAEGQSGWYEKEMLSAQGERIPLSVALFHHDNGTLNEEPLVVGYLRDLREQRMLERVQAGVTAEMAAQLQRQNLELEARTRVLEGMAQLTQHHSLDTDPYALIRRAQIFAQELVPHGAAAYYEPEDGQWRLKSQVGSVSTTEPWPLLGGSLPFGDTQHLIQPWRSGQPYFRDAHDPSGAGHGTLSAALETTIAAIPVFSQGKPRGIFAFGLDTPQRWTETQKVILESLASQLGLVLERLEQTRLLVEHSHELESTNLALEARTRALEGFAELSRDLTLGSTPLAVIGRVQELLVSLLPGSISTYYELDTPDQNGRWQLLSHRGQFPDIALLEALRRGLPHGRTTILDRPYHSVQPFYQDIYDPATNSSVSRQQTGLLRTSVSFPVRAGAAVRGVLVVGRFQTAPWTPADRTVLETVLFSLQLALESAEKTQALQLHAQALERSHAELERFAFIASHDLQEPLRTVSILTERFLSSLADPSESQQRSSQHIRENLRRMQSLLQDLRDFTELGRRQQEPRTVDLGRKVAQALGMLRSRIEQSAAHIAVDDLPAVQGDPVQVQELLTRLLDNALKFTADGQPPRIRISAQRRGPWAEISVQDCGIGISPEHFEQIFTVFQRLHGREQYSGNGIGLSVARRIAELHGGQLWVESQPGEGSTFRFTLPAADGNPPYTAAPATPEAS